MAGIRIRDRLAEPKALGGPGRPDLILGGMAHPLRTWTGGLTVGLSPWVGLGVYTAAVNRSLWASPRSPDDHGALVNRGLVERVQLRPLTVPSSVRQANRVQACAVEGRLRASADPGDR
jgi:hypothetical protein